MTPETEQVIRLMSKASGASFEAIMGRRRKRPLPAMRWLIGRELTTRGYSISYAASEIGLDHATLSYGIRQIKRIALDDKWKPEQKIAAEFYRLLDSETV